MGSIPSLYLSKIAWEIMRVCEESQTAILSPQYLSTHCPSNPSPSNISKQISSLRSLGFVNAQNRLTPQGKRWITPGTRRDAINGALSSLYPPNILERFRRSDLPPVSTAWFAEQTGKNEGVAQKTVTSIRILLEMAEDAPLAPQDNNADNITNGGDHLQEDIVEQTPSTPPPSSISNDSYRPTVRISLNESRDRIERIIAIAKANELSIEFY